MEILGIKPETWFPVLMLILGAVLKTIGDALMEERRAKREADTRAEARSDNRAAANAAFQREALLELQEAIQVPARATGKANVDDSRAYRASGIWGRNQVSAEANDGTLDGIVRLTRFRVRIEDEETRELARSFGASCSMHVSCKSESEAEQCIAESMALFIRLNERIGTLLRTSGR